MTKITAGILAIAFLALAGGIFFLKPLQNGDDLVACTLEAKICPDGSAVGRTGPNCEFAACPDSDGERFSASGTVTGRVTIGPLCPVEPCPDSAPEPYSSRTLMLEPLGGGRPVDLPLYIRLAPDGTFEDEIPEGDYRVTLSECKFLGCRTAFPITISVKANKTLELSLGVDTGIR